MSRDARTDHWRPSSRWLAPLAGWGLFAVLAGCNVDTTGDAPQLVAHCVNLESNATCLADYPGRPFCNTCVPASQFQGCVATLPPLTCSPDGSTSADTGEVETTTSGSSSTSEADTTTTLSSADTTAGSSSTTEAAFECGERGLFDAQCDALDRAAPYCIEAGCVSCTDAGGDSFCADLDPSQPSCNAVTGSCQSCAMADADFCAGAAPVCGDSGECQPCTQHGQCATACHIAPSDDYQGECFPLDQVVWVDGSEPCPGLGTEDSPACSLAEAIALVPMDESWTFFVAGGSPYGEQVVVQGKTVAIRAIGNVQITGEVGLDEASIDVIGAVVYLEGVQVRGNALSHGISCGGGTLQLDDSQIRNNLEYGIYGTSACETTMRRSAMLRNEGGGVRQFGGTLVLDNSAVVSNGDASSGPAINLQYAALNSLYSTIVGNDGVGADSIQCLEAEGSIRNSIVAGVSTNSIELDCFVLELVTNAIDTANFVEDGSVAIGVYESAWFNNPAEGDMRLSDPETTLFGQIALWLPGDPLADADDTPRPLGGEFGYVGVDEP